VLASGRCDGSQIHFAGAKSDRGGGDFIYPPRPVNSVDPNLFRRIGSLAPGGVSNFGMFRDVKDCRTESNRPDKTEHCAVAPCERWLFLHADIPMKTG
jgi:hypothetical protein